MALAGQSHFPQTSFGGKHGAGEGGKVPLIGKQGGRLFGACCVSVMIFNEQLPLVILLISEYQ